MTDLRVLDAEVAERVLGQTAECPGDSDAAMRMADYYDDPTIPAWICRECGTHATGGSSDPIAVQHPRNVLRYSSDPVACALVKARLRDAGIEYVISWDRAEKLTSVGIHSLDDSDVSAPTEEEAVCRFALALVDAGLLPAKEKVST